MVTFAAIKDVVLFALAIYAAILSTFNWRQSVRRAKRRVLVHCSTVLPAFGSHLGNAHISVEATNIGHRPVTVTLLTLELEDHQRIFAMRSGPLPDTALPIELSDGQSARKIFSYAEIGQSLLSVGRTGRVNLTPVCVDTTGGTHRGATLEVSNVYEWTRM